MRLFFTKATNKPTKNLDEKNPKIFDYFWKNTIFTIPMAHKLHLRVSAAVFWFLVSSRRTKKISEVAYFRYIMCLRQRGQTLCSRNQQKMMLFINAQSA